MLGAGERSEDKNRQKSLFSWIFQSDEGGGEVINKFFKGKQSMLMEMRLTEKSIRKAGMLG